MKLTAFRYKKLVKRKKQKLDVQSTMHFKLLLTRNVNNQMFKEVVNALILENIVVQQYKSTF